MRTFDEILPQFLAEKKIQIKPKSLKLIEFRTSVFSEWLTDNNLHDIPIRNIKNTQISDFFIHLAHKGLDRPTCKKYAECVKAVFKYAQKRGECNILPFDLVIYPQKGVDCSARAMTDEELKQITSLIYKKDMQLFVAGMTEYYCGARPGKEVRLLQAKNFDLNAGVLRIDSDNAKTGRTRFITLSDDYTKICKEYGIDKASPNDYVFSRGKKIGLEPISENALRCRFNTYRDRLKLSKDIKFYSFKHTSASRLIKIMDINSVKDFLGHTSINSTQRYIHKIGGGINETLKYNFPSPI